MRNERIKSVLAYWSRQSSKRHVWAIQKIDVSFAEMMGLRLMKSAGQRKLLQIPHFLLPRLLPSAEGNTKQHGVF